MFLHKLSSQEKVNFLKLAHHISKSDNNFSKKQKNIISIYCFEMEINDINYDEDKFILNDTLIKFKTNKTKKIVLLEIMALVYSDSIIHEEEQKIIDTMLDIFGFSQILANIFLEWTKTILAVSEQGKLLIEL